MAVKNLAALAARLRSQRAQFERAAEARPAPAPKRTAADQVRRLRAVAALGRQKLRDRAEVAKARKQAREAKANRPPAIRKADRLMAQAAAERQAGREPVARGLELQARAHVAAFVKAAAGPQDGRAPGAAPPRAGGGTAAPASPKAQALRVFANPEIKRAAMKAAVKSGDPARIAAATDAFKRASGDRRTVRAVTRLRSVKLERGRIAKSAAAAGLAKAPRVVSAKALETGKRGGVFYRTPDGNRVYLGKRFGVS